MCRHIWLLNLAVVIGINWSFECLSCCYSKKWIAIIKSTGNKCVDLSFWTDQLVLVEGAFLFPELQSLQLCSVTRCECVETIKGMDILIKGMLSPLSSAKTVNVVTHLALKNVFFIVQCLRPSSGPEDVMWKKSQRTSTNTSGQCNRSGCQALIHETLSCSCTKE